MTTMQTTPAAPPPTWEELVTANASLASWEHPPLQPDAKG